MSPLWNQPLPRLAHRFSQTQLGVVRASARHGVRTFHSLLASYHEVGHNGSGVAKFAGKRDGALAVDVTTASGRAEEELLGEANMEIVDALDACYRDEAVEVDERTVQSFRDLNDENWLNLERWCREAEPRAHNNLDGASTCWAFLSTAIAASTDVVSVGTLVRMYGLRCRIPFPDFRGEGTWDELFQSRSEEMDFVHESLDEPSDVDFMDLSFLSDFGQSMAANAYYRTDCIDPVRQLRLRLPASGEMVTSMTLVSLLCCSVTAAQTTHEAILTSGALIDPRLIHLVYDDSNLIQPWWTELQGWRGLVKSWKENEYVEIGRTDNLLQIQFQRSINWSNYSSPQMVEQLQQDSDLFDDLDDFLLST